MNQIIERGVVAVICSAAFLGMTVVAAIDGEFDVAMCIYGLLHVHDFSCPLKRSDCMEILIVSGVLKAGWVVGCRKQPVGTLTNAYAIFAGPDIIIHGRDGGIEL